LAALAVLLLIVFVSSLRWLQRSSAPAATAMPAAAAIAQPRTALEFTQEGLGLLRRFDRAGAVEKSVSAFESAIALDKTYAPAWAGLARAYWRQQKDTRDPSLGARAVDAANQAIALDAYLADAHVSVGLARSVAGDLPAAKAAFEHALVLDPTNAGAHRGLGDIAEGEDRLDDAMAHYQKALALDPADWELPRLLGDIPYQAGKYGEALSWYAKASAAAPDSAVPFRLLGAASHMLGDYPAAASAFQKSLTIQPSAGGYTNLGTALFFQGLYRDSLQAFEHAVEMSPSNPLLWGNVADAYRWVPGNSQKMQESYGRAVQLLREQLGKDPKHVANRSRLALYLAKSGNTAAALSELKQVLTPDVREVNTLYRGAVTYELAGQRDAALRTLELALTRGYALSEVRMDPELAKLRADVRYHTLIAKFETAVVSK
jgi:serine/threonine-protein kinase